MESLLEFLILVAFGMVCATIANGRGRNGFLWFLIGFIFNCIGLVVLLVLPNLEEEMAKDERIHAKHRRLGEELKQERIKNQSFRGHVKARLDIHDAALGVDTREQESPAPVELPAPPPPPSTTAINESIEADLPADGWFTAMPGDDAQGPRTLQELKSLILSGDVSNRTLVWNADHDPEWLPMKDTPLRGFLT